MKETTDIDEIKRRAAAGDPVAVHALITEKLELKITIAELTVKVQLRKLVKPTRRDDDAGSN